MIHVGSVPFVNARPLVHWFEDLGQDSPVKVHYAWPSRLPEMLDRKEAAAVLVSSFEALSRPGARFASGVCIASEGPVESVRVLSKVPFAEIQTLALDASSITSNRLAQILLKELFGCEPQTRVEKPDLNDMFQVADACVLIGDLGMAADGEGLHDLDLGQAWTDLTQLPFVWALWVGEELLTPELSALLNVARLMGSVGRNPGQGMQALRRELVAPIAEKYTKSPPRSPREQRDAVVHDAAIRSGWDLEDARRYLTETILYDLSPRALEGLMEFRRRLIERNFMPDMPTPTSVEPKLEVPC